MQVAKLGQQAAGLKVLGIMKATQAEGWEYPIPMDR